LQKRRNKQNPELNYKGKFSCLTELNTSNEEANSKAKPTTKKPAQKKTMFTSDKQIAEYFESRSPIHRLTSLDIHHEPMGELSHQDQLAEGDEEAKKIKIKEREEIIEMRMKFLKQKKKERENKTKEDNLYKYNRDDMIEKVSKIIHKHILFAEENIKHPSQGAMLFDEKNYKRERWKIFTTHGFSSIQPIFLYSLEKVEYEVKACSPEDIMNFIKRIFVDLQLAIECILIMLIYIERLMTMGGVEIRYMNWKPLVFMGVLLASKFWEDLNFWNVDFLGVGQSYSLEGINQIESEFLALCEYNLFVSASLYARYYFAVREKFVSKEEHKERIKTLRLDKFKLKQSRAGYNAEISQYSNLIKLKKNNKSVLEERKSRCWTTNSSVLFN